MNMNNMFNYDYIHQQAQQHHNQQISKIFDAVKKLKDFLDSTDDIEPQYQEMASAEFCAVMFDYMQRHQNKGV